VLGSCIASSAENGCWGASAEWPATRPEQPMNQFPELARTSRERPARPSSNPVS
jgi:hypothetical protein